MEDRTDQRQAGHRQEVQLWRQLVTLTSRINQVLDRQLTRAHDLTLTELLALMALREGPDMGMRQQDLADSVGMDQSSASRLAKRLETKGLANRVRCEHDRRGVYCAITDAGRQRIRAAETTLTGDLSAELDVAAFDERTAAVVARLRFTGSPARIVEESQ
jgi:DNA-binding MarR family transcriptional regulator